MSIYRIPRQTTRVEYVVSNSRFIGTIGRADTVDDARAFIQAVRDEMPDASHHVYAFIVGYGASVIEGMSDDGEPSGTSGPPTLAVLRGADIGDIVVVITRYFGGTKLGTGGLVRAYSQTARDAIAALETELKINRIVAGIEVPYPLYERVKFLIEEYEIDVTDEDFAADVTLMLKIPEHRLGPFRDALQELSAGQVEPTIFEDEEV
ncbi:MAG: YigZ family protein [Chloroflexi bacterium]|nr:YigZ family protein [Chloroflexota bacterium]